MNSFAVLTDSTSDLNAENREKYGITYMPMTFSSPDKTYHASLDWEEISPAAFYGAMREGTAFRTTQVPVPVILQTFRSILEQGQDIVYVGCSSALSGSVNSAAVTAKKLLEEFPGRQIFCVDSKISGMGQGLMAMFASRLRAQGKTAAETAAWLEENKLHFNQCGTTGSLEYLRRAGRVKASSAFFGNLFGVKPLLISDLQGNNLAIRKVKGRNSAILAIGDYVAEFYEKSDEPAIYLEHADCEEELELLSRRLHERLGSEIPILTGSIGPIVGASVGPGTIIAFYYGREKTVQPGIQNT